MLSLIWRYGKIDHCYVSQSLPCHSTIQSIIFLIIVSWNHQCSDLCASNENKRWNFISFIPRLFSTDFNLFWLIESYSYLLILCRLDSTSLILLFQAINEFGWNQMFEWTWNWILIFIWFWIFLLWSCMTWLVCLILSFSWIVQKR